MAVPADSPSYKQALSKFLADNGVHADRIIEIAEICERVATAKSNNETILETVADFKKCCDSLREIKLESWSYSDSFEIWLTERVQQLQQLQKQGAPGQNHVEHFFSEFNQFSPGVGIFCDEKELVEFSNITDEDALMEAIAEKRKQFAAGWKKAKQECEPAVISKHIDAQLRCRQVTQLLKVLIFWGQCKMDLDQINSSSRRLEHCKKKLKNFFADKVKPILEEYKKPNKDFSYRVVQDCLSEACGFVSSLRDEVDYAIEEARSRKDSWAMRTIMSGLNFAASVYQLQTESVTKYASAGVKFRSQCLAGAEAAQTLMSATMWWWGHLDEKAWAEFRTVVEEAERDINDELKKLEKAQKTVEKTLRCPEGFGISAA